MPTHNYLMFLKQESSTKYVKSIEKMWIPIFLNEYKNKEHSFDFKQNIFPAITSFPPPNIVEGLANDSCKLFSFGHYQPDNNNA